jgi:hypothetical protein
VIAGRYVRAGRGGYTQAVAPGVGRIVNGDDDRGEGDDDGDDHPAGRSPLSVGAQAPARNREWRDVPRHRRLSRTQSRRLVARRNDPLDLASKPPLIGRIVTATIAVVCLLIVYDGWAALKPVDVVVVIVGPIVAICTTHIFSGTLVQLVELGRRPTTKEWLAEARFELRFLLLAVPPLVVLLVLHLASVALADAIRVVIWLEALSLAFWAGLAAWYAGLRGQMLVRSVLAGLVLSGVVLLLQLILSRGRWPRDSQHQAPTRATHRAPRSVARRLLGRELGAAPARRSGAVCLAVDEDSAALRLNSAVCGGWAHETGHIRRCRSAEGKSNETGR